MILSKKETYSLLELTHKILVVWIFNVLFWRLCVVIKKKSLYIIYSIQCVVWSNIKMLKVLKTSLSNLSGDRKRRQYILKKEGRSGILIWWGFAWRIKGWKSNIEATIKPVGRMVCEGAAWEENENENENENVCLTWCWFFVMILFQKTVVATVEMWCWSRISMLSATWPPLYERKGNKA